MCSCNQVKRSSGGLLEATGQDGKVLPELLAEHDGPQWPKASATTQASFAPSHSISFTWLFVGLAVSRAAFIHRAEFVNVVRRVSLIVSR